MKILADGPLAVNGILHPGGIPFPVDEALGKDLIQRGVARHAAPPRVFYEKESREQNADLLRDKGVTCLCITRNRREWLPAAIESYLGQAYEPRELLIIADGEDVRDLVPEREDIQLIHVEEGRTIGEKRNFGVGQARGKYVAHWDDDDRSSPDRLLQQSATLRASSRACTGFHQIDFEDGKGSWWRYTGDPGYAPGSSMFYEREFAIEHPFPLIQVGEDGEFCGIARRHNQIMTVPSNGMLTATIHPGNTSPRNLHNEMWQKLERSAAGLTVIIPSRTVSNLVQCMFSVRARGHEGRIVVIDDGLEDSRELQSTGAEFLAGEKPFVFARNINAGIRSAGRDDVLLLNDDAMLQTKAGFSLLQTSAKEHPEFGLIAATTNAVGNGNQLPRGIGLREDPRMVCFVAVFIPRSTLDRIGYLDERFTAYGFEDDDFCYRVRRAGLKIGIYDGCFVDHASLKSTFRGQALEGGNLEGGRRIFEEKWGAYPL